MSEKAEKIKFYIGRIKAGRVREILRQLLWVYEYSKRYWPAMIFYTLIGMSTTGLTLLNATISRDLVDIITGQTQSTTPELIRAFVYMVLLNLGLTVLGQVSNFISSYVSMKVNTMIQADIFEQILETDWESLSKYHTGDLLARWGSDTGTISSAVLKFIPNVIIYVVRFASALWMVLKNDWTFAIFAFASIPVSMALSKTLMRRMVNNNQRSAALAAKASGFNQETFSNIQTIKAFDLVGAYVKYLKQIQQDYINMKIDFAKMSVWTSLILTTVGLVVSYGGYGWGIYRVATGVITYGSMTMFLSLTGTLTSAVNNLTSLVPGVISLSVSVGRIMDIIGLPREDYSKREEVKKFFDENGRDGVSLSLNDARYAYANGTLVFDGASLEAKPHEIIGLVGPSGEGKTTMMRLLLSLIDPADGLAKVCAGNDTSDESMAFTLSPSTRQLFSYVPQGNTMFSGSIAQNMRNVKEDATDEEIIEALKKACAWEFVQKMPEGINTVLQERGGGVSEGQAQRLSIARALLRRSPILLLDEATSALDNATESQVLENIMKDEYPRTCIITTHRPAVLGSCTRVYEIQDKKCVVLSEEEIKELMAMKPRPSFKI